jgi:hypothetical protein
MKKLILILLLIPSLSFASIGPSDKLHYINKGIMLTSKCLVYMEEKMKPLSNMNERGFHSTDDEILDRKFNLMKECVDKEIEKILKGDDDEQNN